MASSYALCGFSYFAPDVRDRAQAAPERGVRLSNLDSKPEEMNMEFDRMTDSEQAKLWNGPAAQAWVESQSLLDQILEPMKDLLVQAVVAQKSMPRRVLDVGCGTGSTTLAVARLLGTKGCCVGIDISEPMICAARARLEREGARANFICANVQTHTFEPASFDMIISRFGVMFFEDPIQAFANLAHAATEHAEMRFIAWRDPSENPFMTTAERAAAPLLPNLPARRPDAPGQFAFADQGRVHGILAASGWTEIDVRPIDVACALPEGELIRYLTRFGPVGRALEGVDERVRAQVIEKVRTAFNSFVHGTEVRFTAACWLVSARSRPV